MLFLYLKKFVLEGYVYLWYIKYFFQGKNYYQISQKVKTFKQKRLKFGELLLNGLHIDHPLAYAKSDPVSVWVKIDLNPLVRPWNKL